MNYTVISWSVHSASWEILIISEFELLCENAHKSLHGETHIICFHEFAAGDVITTFLINNVSLHRLLLIRMIHVFYVTVKTSSSFTFSLTSSYLDLQRSADEGHKGGGKVDRHVLIHRHVHQDKSLMAVESVIQSVGIQRTNKQSYNISQSLTKWKPRAAVVDHRPLVGFC